MWKGRTYPFSTICNTQRSDVMDLQASGKRDIRPPTGREKENWSGLRLFSCIGRGGGSRGGLLNGRTLSRSFSTPGGSGERAGVLLLLLLLLVEGAAGIVYPERRTPWKIP